MVKHECKYYSRSMAGQLVCSVCGKPAHGEPLITEKRELYVSDKDRTEAAEAKAKEEEEAKLKEEADAKAKGEGKQGEAPSGQLESGPQSPQE